MYEIRRLTTIFGGITIIRTNHDGSITSFCENLDNVDYQEFQRWLSEGNTPITEENQGQ